VDDVTADYVIIGAGSAGCVLADRLSADSARVVLLEAGPPDRVLWIHIPAGVLKLLRHPRVNWNYRTEPEPGTGGRAIEWPRGKTLGGTSSINGMLWVRGNRADYDRWAQMGARGWSYEDVLPHLRSIESYAPGDPDWRGKDGPVCVSDYNTVNPLTHCFVQAAQQAGVDFNRDLSGVTPAEGVGYSQMSRAGRFRASTARAFLKNARGRPSLSVETGAMATRLLFDGRRCTGVAVRQDGRDRVFRAVREVILSGGTINSPHLLQVSGIGPAEHLRGIGVDPVHDLRGVGQNLSDHYVTRVAMRVRDVVTINQYARGWRLLVEAAKWAALGTGALTFGVSSAQAYIRSRPELASPDLQLLFTPASYSARFGELEREPGMTCAVSIASPESRGEVMARSPDPFEHPALRPNYLSSRADLAALLHGIRVVRRIFAQPAFERYRVAETSPGARAESDEALEAFAREAGTTLYHIVGTCRMGEDPMAVVDPRLRVHGIEGLRVADASVMPTVTTGNTNATAIMIGEKAAAMIREDAR
jgi:choline dehydrogenase